MKLLQKLETAVALTLVAALPVQLYSIYNICTRMNKEAEAAERRKNNSKKE